MIAREKNLNYISDILSFLKTRVELRNSLSLFDPNIHAEYFYSNLLNLVYGLDLKNINAETKNAGHIDLIDRNAKRAIQVTSQNDKAKIEKTLKGFYADSANAEYELQLLLIAKEAKNYRGDFSIEGKYRFDHKKDVLDIQRLLTDISKLDEEKLEEIAKFLSRAIKDKTGPQNKFDEPALSRPLSFPRPDDRSNRSSGGQSHTIMGTLAVVALVVVFGVVAIVVYALSQKKDSGSDRNFNTVPASPSPGQATADSNSPATENSNITSTPPAVSNKKGPALNKGQNKPKSTPKIDATLPRCAETSDLTDGC